MSWLKISGMVLAGCLVLMSLAHGFLGWPTVRAEFEKSGVSRGSEAWTDASAGWVFGSVSMFVFGVIFASVALSLCKGRTNIVPVVALGLGFLTFGIGACLLLGVGGHFVGFAVFGLLFLVWAFAARQGSCTPAEERP